MSSHERDAVEFVLNPLAAFKVLAGIDNDIAIEIVKALKTIYLDRNCKWD